MHAWNMNTDVQHERSDAVGACLQVCNLRGWQGESTRGSGKQNCRLLTVLLQLTRSKRGLLPGNLCCVYPLD